MPHAVLSILLTLGGAHAYRKFQTKIPNGDNVYGCYGNRVQGVGHRDVTGGGLTNQFGLDFKAASFSWTPELCEMDSDGDNVSNGKELGDPNCTWVEGEVPDRVDGITHPGKDCSVEDETWAQLQVILLHGIVMMIAWVLILPMGAAVAMFWRDALGDPLWFHTHMSLQAGGVALVLAGAFFAWVSVGYERDLIFDGPSGTHHLMGIILVGALLFQVVVGICRPKRVDGDSESKARSRWYAMHGLVGFVVLCVGIFQVVGGIFLFRELHGFAHGPMLTIFFVCSFGFTVFAFVGWYLTSEMEQDEKDKRRALRRLARMKLEKLEKEL